MSHTSEPWQVHDPGNGYVQVVGSIDTNHDGTAVVAVIVCEVHDNNCEQANARLIASAPRLLAACVAAEQNLSPMYSGDHLVMRLLRAAIAEAT